MANKIILNLPEQIISSTGSSAWLNALYIILISFIFVLLIFKLMKKFIGLDIIDISGYIGGKILKILMGILQIVILFLIATTIIRSFSYTLKTIYFIQSPIFYIIVFMVLPVIVANKCGLKSISKICIYVLPIAYIGLAILLLAPAKDFEVQRIYPILGYGINATFIAGLSNLYALSGLRLYFFDSTIFKR